MAFFELTSHDHQVLLLQIRSFRQQQLARYLALTEPAAALVVEELV